MIKIRTFKLDEWEEANKFLEIHSPRSTEKQSGMFFHSDYIGIIYDDGKDNPEDRRATMRLRLEGERQKYDILEHEVESAKIELPEAEKDLEKVMIPGYTPQTSNGGLKELLQKSGKSTKGVYAGDLEKVKTTINTAIARVESLKGLILTNEFELRRTKYSIQGYEKLLGLLKK